MATAGATLLAAAKSYKTAAVVLPPRALWAPMQEERVFADKSFCRWPPHCNLLYPFVEREHFPAAALRCRDALRSAAPFDLTLADPGFFDHGRSCKLWLHPTAPELLRVQAALQAAFPQCDDLSSDAARGIEAFTPHLSLGQHGRGDVEAAVRQLADAWQPLTFRCEGVALLSRRGHGDPFSLAWWVPFGGGEPLALDAPYVATVGDSALPPPPAWPGGDGADAADSLAQRLVGLGAARRDGTAWNFAYGANTAPSKLTGARGLRPLESLPAALPGWRLAFTHRGGMGNLEAAAGGAAHGVLHRLRAADLAALSCAEHEYRPVEVLAAPYGGGGPVAAVAYVTPEHRRIAAGLPPPLRYLALLREGARHWRLDAEHAAQLEATPGVDGRLRDWRYYTAASGEPLAALPKIRTGSQPRQRRGQGQPDGQQPRGEQARQPGRGRTRGKR